MVAKNTQLTAPTPGATNPPASALSPAEGGAELSGALVQAPEAAKSSSLPPPASLAETLGRVHPPGVRCASPGHGP